MKVEFSPQGFLNWELSFQIKNILKLKYGYNFAVLLAYFVWFNLVVLKVCTKRINHEEFHFAKNSRLIFGSGFSFRPLSLFANILLETKARITHSKIILFTPNGSSVRFKQTKFLCHKKPQWSPLKFATYLQFHHNLPLLHSIISYEVKTNREAQTERL